MKRTSSFLPLACLGCAALLAACTTNPYTAEPSTPVASVPPTATAPTAGEPELQTQGIAPTAPVEEPEALPPVTRRSYSLNPASRALVAQATTQRNRKNFMQAAATLERALRIEPNNPLLWLEYGELRMDEGNYAQAESMGRKAAALAVGDPRAQSNAWQLVADSLRARDKNSEAQQAAAKANALMAR